MTQHDTGLFAERYEISRPAEGLVYERVPDAVRNGYLNLLEEGMRSTSLTWSLCFREFLTATDKWEPNADLVTPTHVGDFVRTCRWYSFFNIVETTCAMFRTQSSDACFAFMNSFSNLLRRNYMGYELREGRIERVGAQESEKTVASARGILRDPELAGPDEQFQKAIGFFNKRPQPDLENCVKDAVGAVEGLARIFLDDASIQLNDAITQIGEAKAVHKAIRQMVEKLYAYRGDAPGAGHAKTSHKPPVRIEDAELVLHTSAACIVYLARLYGKSVE